MTLFVVALSLALGGVGHDKDAARERALYRVSKIENLLGAMRRRDQSAFSAAGGNKIAFSPVRDDGFVERIGPQTRRLSINAFDGFASCKPTRARMTGVDWYSVLWDCPDDGPVADAQFSFKFSGTSLIAVQASALPPRIVRVR